MSTPVTQADTRARVVAAAPLTILGLVSVIVGGGLAAVAGGLPPGTDTSKLSWATAYIVLVAGVAAIGFGVGQAALGKHVPRPVLVYAELLLFYVGNVCVLVGSLAAQRVFSYVGGALLVLALLLLIYGARGARGTALRWLLYLYRILLVVILLGIPIGLVLAHLRA